MFHKNDIVTRSLRLQNFANEKCGGGYMKGWKANGMILTLDDIPDILNDQARLKNYVGSCLKMEGFSDHSCDRIVEFIRDEYSK